MKCISAAFLALLGLWSNTTLAMCVPYPECEAMYTPPTVEVTGPVEGATAVAPGPFTLTANAYSENSPVWFVAFYANGVKVGFDTTPPYSMTYSDVKAGTYTITAEAVDMDGLAAVSSNSRTVTVTGNAPPKVKLTGPANGAISTEPGSFTLTATASDIDGTVAQVQFYSNGALIGTDATAPYSIPYYGLWPGTYAITAKATDNLGAVSTSGTATVTVTKANAPPTITLLSPTNGTTFASPGGVNYNASASDSDGTIREVQFYFEHTLVKTISAAPYTFTYSSIPPGTYSVYAVAVDDLGASMNSDVVTVTVTKSNVFPTVAWVSPAAGTTRTAPAVFTLTVDASDSDGTIRQVDFYSNGQLLATDTSAPYSYAYSGVPPGNYSLVAKATDNVGAVTTSAALSVTSTLPAVNKAPVVTWVTPANGATGTAPASFALSANATDSDGTIRQVDFYADGRLLFSDSASPYSYSYAGVAAGTHLLTADATDNLGKVTTSAAISVTVTGAPNTAPTVTLTEPSNGGSATAPGNFTLRANASDADGSVAKVEFFSNSALIGTATSAPYSIAFTNLGSGTYALSAKATDNLGLSSALSGATVTVSAGGELSVTRTYVYDVAERLCKTINPESGATLVDYDAAGNVSWSVEGSGLTGVNCDRDSVPVAARTTRSYDTRNRVIGVATPGGAADLTTSYTPTGKVSSVGVANPGGGVVTTSYEYNRRGLLVRETLSQLTPPVTYPTGYAYNANGHLAALTYPDGQTVSYAPNALGQATQVGSYATSIGYYPNGAISGFTYGNGITHTMQQNRRQLPMQSQDFRTGLVVLDDTYAFDENGNVTSIKDAANADLATRRMAYDDRDRLTSAEAPGLWKNATFRYDGLDNLTAANQDTRSYRYAYASNQRLAQINDANGIKQYSFGYDAAGNVTSKNSQALVFDIANRLTQVTGQQTYRYDGLGRRVQTTDAGGQTTFWQYSQSGQMLYASEARRGRNTEYIYLGNTLLAERHKAWTVGTVTVEYDHTDALGSPAVKTDSSGQIISRNFYSPYGEVVYGAPVDGPGYTGHVMDAGTGLTYMQQRYYDPQIGRFLSNDPVATAPNTGTSFNRYNYAANNPYYYIDPDGRVIGEAIKETAIAALKKLQRRMIRTAGDRAVKAAWKMERQLVASGARGTRDWTAREKQELLSRGRVKGYDGHHMNTKQGQPEMAGNPDNIDFMKTADHQELHAEEGGTQIAITDKALVDRTDGGKIARSFDQNGYATRGGAAGRISNDLSNVAAGALGVTATVGEVLDYTDPLTYIFYIPEAR